MGTMTLPGGRVVPCPTHVAPEPTTRDLHASYASPRNTRLARALWPFMALGFCYERFSAHRWALKLIRAAPASGAETMACLMNEDWMIEGALRQYYNEPREQQRYDAIYAVYAAWVAKEHV